VTLPDKTLIESPESEDLLRSEVYENILPSLISKARIFVQKRYKDGIVYIPLEDFIIYLQVNKNIALTVIQNLLYPAVIIPGVRMYPHTNGIIIELEKPVITRTEMTLPSAIESQPSIEKRCDIEALISPPNIPTNADFFVATYKLYTDIDSSCWLDLAKRCIETRSPLIDKFAGYLLQTGALISREELPKLNYPDMYKYIGYVDIFNTTTFQVTLYNPRTQTYRDPTDLEVRQITSGRTEFQRPTQSIYGILMPR
jgi:hypothetical protein